MSNLPFVHSNTIMMVHLFKATQATILLWTSRDARFHANVLCYFWQVSLTMVRSVTVM